MDCSAEAEVNDDHERVSYFLRRTASSTPGTCCDGGVEVSKGQVQRPAVPAPSVVLLKVT